MKNDLVLLHGAIGASDQLPSLKTILSEKFKVTTFDFFGHGKRSNEGIEFSIPNFAKDILPNTPHPIEKVNMDQLVFEINKFLP